MAEVGRPPTGEAASWMKGARWAHLEGGKPPPKVRASEYSQDAREPFPRAPTLPSWSPSPPLRACDLLLPCAPNPGSQNWRTGMGTQEGSGAEGRGPALTPGPSAEALP